MTSITFFLSCDIPRHKTYANSEGVKKHPGNRGGMWVNFGYYGDPTPPGSEVPVQWGQVAPDNHQYLIIDKTLEMALEDDYLARMAIWDETYKYPCNTVGRSRAGSLMGAPCSFPFRYPDCKELSN